MEAQENKLGIIKSFKYFTKWDLTHDDFTCLFSDPVKYEIYFLRLPWEIVLVLLRQITNYIYNLWKV